MRRGVYWLGVLSRCWDHPWSRVEEGTSGRGMRQGLQDTEGTFDWGRGKVRREETL